MPGPYDKIFKHLAEDDPRGLLHLFGAVPLDREASVEVRTLPRDLTFPARFVDHVYLVHTRDGDEIQHFECQTTYPADLGDRLTWYATMLAYRYRRPVRTTLVLLVERHIPSAVPTCNTLEFGAIRLTVTYRVVKLWELDAAAAIKLNRPALFPWVPLMNCSPEQLQAATNFISNNGDGSLAAIFATLGGLRYGKASVPKLLEEASLMIGPDIIEQSSFIQMIEEYARKRLDETKDLVMEEGRQQGLSTGRLTEVRKIANRMVSLRLPGIDAADLFERVEDLATLEKLCDELVLATDSGAALEALKRVLG